MSAEIESSRESITPGKIRVAQREGVLHPEDSVETAGERMRKNDAGAWPVVENSRLVGMVADKNPDWKVGGHGHNPASEKVGDIMTRDAIYCHEDDDCAYAEELMREHGLTHIPVVDREMRVIGIFSKKEIAVMMCGSDGEKETVPLATEIAVSDGRMASTEKDFAKAASEAVKLGDTTPRAENDLPNCHA
jgi:CBS domain-containing protein